MAVAAAQPVGPLFPNLLSVAQQAYKDPKVGTYWVGHPHVSTILPNYQGRARSDNVAAWGVGAALGRNIDDINSGSDLSEFLKGAMENPAVLNHVNTDLANPLTQENLTFIPMYSRQGFDTAKCKTTCPTKWNGPTSFQSLQRLHQEYNSDSLGGRTKLSFDNWLMQTKENYYNPKWQTECEMHGL